MPAGASKSPSLLKAVRAAPGALRSPPERAAVVVVPFERGKPRGRPFQRGSNPRLVQTPGADAPSTPCTVAELTAVSVLAGGLETPDSVPPLTNRERQQEVSGRLLRMLEVQSRQLAATGLPERSVATQLADTFFMTVPGVRKVLKRSAEAAGLPPGSSEPPAPKRQRGRLRVFLDADIDAALAAGRKDSDFFFDAARGALLARGVEVPACRERTLRRRLGPPPGPGGGVPRALERDCGVQGGTAPCEDVRHREESVQAHAGGALRPAAKDPRPLRRVRTVVARARPCRHRAQNSAAGPSGPVRERRVREHVPRVRHRRDESSPRGHAAALRRGELHRRVAHEVPRPPQRAVRQLGVPLLRARARQEVHATVAAGAEAKRQERKEARSQLPGRRGV